MPGIGERCKERRRQPVAVDFIAGFWGGKSGTCIPSVSVPGRIDQSLLDAFELTSRLFEDAGVTVGRLDLPDTAPVVTGEIPAPAGALLSVGRNPLAGIAAGSAPSAPHSVQSTSTRNGLPFSTM